MGSNKFINDWNCPSCNTLQSKHNQCMGEDGVCEECFIQIFSPKEQEKLDNFRNIFKLARGLKNISGGFVNIEDIDLTVDEIRFKIKWGTSDENGSYVMEDYMTLDRETFQEI